MDMGALIVKTLDAHVVEDCVLDVGTQSHG